MTDSLSFSALRESPFWNRWRPLAVPSLFFALVIYYEEILLKLFCFQSLPLSGAWFTLLFSFPVALLLGLLCNWGPAPRGRILLPLLTALLSLWIGSQMVYFRMFKTFLTLFSVTKMAMVAGAFGDMAFWEIVVNWFPILLMILPTVLAVLLRKRLVPARPETTGLRLRWAALAAILQLAAMGLVMLCGNGVLSLRYIYTQAAAPALEAKYFGMLTQTQLEIRRVLFGIKPDPQNPAGSEPEPPNSTPPPVASSQPGNSSEPDQTSAPPLHVLPIDFDTLIAQTDDKDLLAMHQWFSQRPATPENQWTGYFEGKNLVWIVAEGFSTLAIDPQRTPVLWKLSHQGFLFEHFYTPLWGVSTSDGEYVTTTGLIPKSGVWSYSRSSANYMPFALGTQFQKLGYRTMAFHDYLYDYYDRNWSHPNMGYEYYAMGQGLEPEDIIPPNELEQNGFPPSDRMMMEKIVPMFVHEDHFMVYCLTVSGHLNYNLEENAMSRLHWDEVADLPYSDGVKCYLACQQELELALESLLDQLETAGKLDDTVIVLSADHYPYGLSDEEYSELLGHEVDPVFEIFENTLILWNAAMDQTVRVEKYCSSLDVMPTLSNLFGLPYDSRLLMGEDILSDGGGLEIGRASCRERV